MTYNTDPRKPLRGKARTAFLEEHGSMCYWCRLPIVDDKWDDEHVIPRELMAPGSGADDLSNRKPIHRGACHTAKTALDRKLIAKSNRIRRSHGPVEGRRKTKHPIRSRKAQWPKRPFPKQRSK